MYSKGDRVRIVGGTYKKHTYATYLQTCGTKMCSVRIGDGKNSFIRDLRLTSIVPVSAAAAVTSEDCIGEGDLSRRVLDLEGAVFQLKLLIISILVATVVLFWRIGTSIGDSAGSCGCSGQTGYFTVVNSI